MNALLARIRCESGQAMVFVAFGLIALVGMAALVIDGGSWYRAQRQLQTAADAAALAGAQELPLEPALAQSDRGAATRSRTTPASRRRRVTLPDAGDDRRRREGDSARVLRSGSTARPSTRSTVRAHAQARVYAPDEAEERRADRRPQGLRVHRLEPGLLRPDR